MEKRCMGCMKIKVNRPVCEHCGYNELSQNETDRLPVGTTLRGRYQIGKTLGQGGFGITYIGWDTLLDHPVAIKEYFPRGIVMRDSSLNTKVHCYTNVREEYEKSKARFLREAKTLAKFMHIPEIVEVKDFFEENDTAYIVMEYVDGINIHQYMKTQGGQLGVQQTLTLLKPVMEALIQVHKGNIIHRDISPDNIMILDGGRTKLLDFGAVREVENPDAKGMLSQSTQTILKRGFAPVEQYRSRGSLGPWTDVYALCATIYCCITGEVPPESQELMLEREEINWDQVPGLNDRQRRILQKGTALLPDQRLKSVEELCADLYSSEAQTEMAYQPVLHAQNTPILQEGTIPFVDPLLEKPDQKPYTAPLKRNVPENTVQAEYTAPADVTVKKNHWEDQQIPESSRPQKHKKHIGAVVIALVLVLLAGFGIFGGGKKQDTVSVPNATETQGAKLKEEEPIAPAGNVTKVALVTDYGNIDDMFYNQACWEGVTDWCIFNGVSLVHYRPAENTSDARILSIAQAVAEGADTIVLPGYAFGAALPTVMEAYPDVKFIAVDVGEGDLTTDYFTYYDPLENTACVTFAEEQAGYLAGYAAVKDGYTKLGFLGGMAVPAVIRYGYGFVQGADAAAQELGIDIKLNYAYANQYFADAGITAQMNTWYASGTEVVFACGGGIYTSVVEAANNHDGKVIGLDVDQYYVDDCIITSAMKQLKIATITLLQAAHNGTFANYGGKVSNFSLAEGEYVGLPTANDSWRMSTFTQEEYEEVKTAIAEGRILVDDNTEIDIKASVSGNTAVKHINFN